MWVEANSGSGGGGGGGETETTLWTNPSPNAYFPQQTVTLSDDYTNYDKIAIYYRVSATDSAESRVIYASNDITDDWFGSSREPFFGGLCVMTSSIYFRYFAKGSDPNKFTFYVSYKAGSVSSSTDYCIPTKITGIN